MSEEKYNANIADASQAENGTAEQRPIEPKSAIWVALGSLIVTIAAWIVATVNGFAAVGVGFVAIVLGIVALKSRRALTRNISITSLIAAGILLVVVAAFLIVVYLGLKSV